MPIKDFSELFDEWKKQQEKKMFKPTNNVTKETFNYVVSHPGCRSHDLVTYITSIGLNPSSATAILTACVKQKKIKRENGKYFALQNVYTPLKFKYKKAEQKPEPEVVKVPEPAKPPRLSAEYIVSHIPVNEAKALYIELKEIFENV